MMTFNKLLRSSVGADLSALAVYFALLMKKCKSIIASSSDAGTIPGYNPSTYTFKRSNAQEVSSLLFRPIEHSRSIFPMPRCDDFSHNRQGHFLRRSSPYVQSDWPVNTPDLLLR